MIEARLEQVRRQKEQATALRQRDRFDRAVKTLEEAIGSLEGMLADPGLSESDARAIRAELADTFGMMGGIHRRQGALQRALEAYRSGRKIEARDGQSTYNLSNVITLAITHEARSPVDKEIGGYLQEAVAQLEKETEGPRKDEWWAWADLGQFYLLLDQPDKARETYKKGRERTGPRVEDVKRHAAILDDLAEKVATTSPGVSRNIRATAAELTAST